MQRLIATLLLMTLAIPGQVRADFIDWWLTPDQQGRLHYRQGDYTRAARVFVDPRWKALAYYAAGDYVSAAALFETFDDIEGLFYLGNSRARQEHLAEAVAAYEQVLILEPGHAEAQFNLEWVSGLLELDQKEYDDAGGTGGKLGADRIVFDDKASNAQSTTTLQELKSQGFSDQEIQDRWMRRVQTTPGDFLKLKFGYQLQNPSDDGTAAGDAGDQG